MTPGSPVSRWQRRLLWRALKWAHHVDFAWILPAIAHMPLGLAYRAADWRGRFSSMLGRDWRSMALGRRHIRAQSLSAYRLLSTSAGEESFSSWCAQRFMVEAREEFEAQLVAARRLDLLTCTYAPNHAMHLGPGRKRGLVLLTPHFDSFFLGVAFLARTRAKVNLMSSAVTRQPEVDEAVTRHFSDKYRGLEHYLNGGKVLDMEAGLRQFYRILERGEILVVLGDAPVLPDGVSAQVNFLGARRQLAGGALRMAQHSDSELGAYVCRHVSGHHYRLELSTIGPADDPRSIDAAYAFLGSAIEADPGRWWGADLLINLPPSPQSREQESAVAPTSRVAQEATRSQHSDCEVVVFSDSLLQGTQELAFGLETLRRQLAAPAGSAIRVHNVTRHSAPTPMTFLSDCVASQVLVVLDPALVTTDDVRQELSASLLDSGATCVVAAGRVDATGEWAIDYCTRSELERYVRRRQAMPRHEAYRSHTPQLYLLRTDAARSFLERHPSTQWAELPGALALECRLAPRAFVHAYGDYQMSTRTEMLELLPGSVLRLLDVGGGDGGFVRAYATRPGVEGCLLEPGPVAAQRARERGVTVFESTVEALDVASVGLFDAVSFLDVLEHLEAPITALRRVKTVLNPGGFVLLSVPNVGFWPIVRDLLIGRFDYLPVGILCNTHLRFFTERSLMALLEDAGFRVVTIRRTRHAMPSAIASGIQSLIGPDDVIDLQSLETDSLHVLATLR